tara:strand:+ start:25 stop:858 length:834 start_codon:yes stop_codon:yes gene_type:complete
MGLLTKKFKLLFDYYINSSLHVSFCVICYIISINLINQIHVNWEDIAFVFFTTFFSYNFIKFNEVLTSINKPVSLLLKSFFLKALISLVISLYLFFNLSSSKQIFVVIISIVTVLYTIPLISNYTLRDNPILKILTVAFCWTMLIVIFPFFGVLDFVNIVYYSLLIFCLVTAQMIPFEIRDMLKDKDLVKTIIHNYGIKYSKNIGYFVLIIALLFTMITGYLLENLVFKNSILIIILITAILVNFSREKQNKYYSSFIVESVPVYWLIVEIGLQILL